MGRSGDRRAFPFGAVDEQAREMMRGLTLHVFGGAMSTAVFVIHNVEKPICLADHVVVPAPN